MKRISHYEVGVMNGEHYRLRYDQRQNVQPDCDYRWRKTWRWFLWANGDYQGDFNLRREAIKHLLEETK